MPTCSSSWSGVLDSSSW